MRAVDNILINNIAYIAPTFLRSKIYKAVGYEFNKSDIGNRCYFDSKNVIIGKGSFINKGCEFHVGRSKTCNIQIGERCYLGINVKLICQSHKIGDCFQRAGENTYEPILIKDGAWIGANTTILQGVTIGEGVVIGACSVVIRDCEPNSLYVGNPAKKIRELS